MVLHCATLRKYGEVEFVSQPQRCRSPIDRPTLAVLGNVLQFLGICYYFSSSIGSPSCSAGCPSKFRPSLGSFFGLFFGTIVPLIISELFHAPFSRTTSVLGIVQHRVDGVVRKTKFLGSFYSTFLGSFSSSFPQFVPRAVHQVALRRAYRENQTGLWRVKYLLFLSLLAVRAKARERRRCRSSVTLTILANAVGMFRARACCCSVWE